MRIFNKAGWGGRRSLALGGAGLGLTLLLSAAASSAPLTSTQANRVVIQYYHSNLRANNSLDTALLNTVEEGVSATMDDRAYSLLASAGQTSESSPRVPTKADISISLSGSSAAEEFLAQTRWPKESGSTPSAAAANYLIFRKDGRSKPWRVLYEPWLSPGLPSPHLLASNAVVKSNGSRATFSELASYYDGGSEHFSPGPLTSQWIAALKRDRATALSAGVVDTQTYKVGRAPITTVLVTNGTLEFGTLTETFVATPSQAGGCLETNASSGQELVGIAPVGVPYRSVTQDFLYQDAIFVPADHHHKPQVLGEVQQLMSAVTPAC